GICIQLPAGLNVWLSSGRVAFWRCRNHLGRNRAAEVAKGIDHARQLSGPSSAGACRGLARDDKPFRRVHWLTVRLRPSKTLKLSPRPPQLVISTDSEGACD